MTRTPRKFSSLRAILLAVNVIVAATGCASTTTQATQPTPSPTLSASPSGTGSAQLPPAVSGTLGPPPSNCATTPPPSTLTVANFGGGFFGSITFSGASPAWEFGMDTTVEVATGGSAYPSTKVMWVVGPNYAQPVTLSGRDLRSGAPLWFDVYAPNFGPGTEFYTTSAVLDPARPNRGSTTNSLGAWNIWGIGLVIETASCYELDVASTAGSWHTDFAAGAGAGQ